MIPPIVALAKENPVLVALLGSNPFRFFAFGDAGQDPVYPYVTYQVVAGLPENYLAGRPDSDSWVLQVDCWSKTESEAIAVAAGVRDAVELDAYITNWGGSNRDPVTRNYRFNFTVEFITDR